MFGFYVNKALYNYLMCVVLFLLFRDGRKKLVRLPILSTIGLE